MPVRYSYTPWPLRPNQVQMPANLEWGMKARGAKNSDVHLFTIPGLARVERIMLHHKLSLTLVKCWQWLNFPPTHPIEQSNNDRGSLGMTGIV